MPILCFHSRQVWDSRAFFTFVLSSQQELDVQRLQNELDGKEKGVCLLCLVYLVQLFFYSVVCNQNCKMQCAVLICTAICILQFWFDQIYKHWSGKFDRMSTLREDTEHNCTLYSIPFRMCTTSVWSAIYLLLLVNPSTTCISILQWMFPHASLEHHFWAQDILIM